MAYWLLVLLGYVIGTFPTAYVFGRRRLGRDIRKMGDGNMGARNAWHEISHRTGVIVGFIDGAKGGLAVLVAQWFDAPQSVVLATGLAVILGHNFPVFLGFRGGRGEATAIGVLYVVVPLPMLIISVPTILTLLIVKNVIIASAVLFIGLPLAGWWADTPGGLILYGLGLAITVALTHLFRVWRVEKPASAGSG